MYVFFSNTIQNPNNTIHLNPRTNRQINIYNGTAMTLECPFLHIKYILLKIPNKQNKKKTNQRQDSQKLILEQTAKLSNTSNE